MRIKNSSRVATAKIRKLLAFILPYCTHSDRARLEVKNARFGYMTRGLTTFVPPRDSGNLVEIAVSRANVRYPYRSQYWPGFPGVDIRDWDEEVVFVLAHELKHVDDYWEQSLGTSQRQMELRAEKFAIRILKAWRAKNRRRRQS